VLLAYTDADYPRLLNLIEDATPILSVLGQTSLLHKPRLWRWNSGAKYLQCLSHRFIHAQGPQ